MPARSNLHCAVLFLLVLLNLALAGCSARNVLPPDAQGVVDDGSGNAALANGMRTMDSLFFNSGGDDYALFILKDVAEDSIEVPRAWEGVRPLLLYRLGPTEQRELLLRNDSLVMCQGCGGIFGDPYSGIEFINDTLKLYHYGGSNWRWAETHQFVRGSRGDWPLVARTSVSFSVFDPDSTRQVTVHMPKSTERLATCTTAW